MTKQSAIPRMPSPIRLDLTDARRWNRKACRGAPASMTLSRNRTARRTASASPFQSRSSRSPKGSFTNAAMLMLPRLQAPYGSMGDLAADVNSLYLHPVVLGGGLPEHSAPEQDTGLRRGPGGLKERLPDPAGRNRPLDPLVRGRKPQQDLSLLLERPHEGVGDPDRDVGVADLPALGVALDGDEFQDVGMVDPCLLYTSDAADDLLC